MRGFNEYVVQELSHRGYFDRSISGTIRAMVSEQILQIAKHNENFCFNFEGDLESAVKEYGTLRGEGRTKTIRTLVTRWVDDHIQPLEQLGISMHDPKYRNAKRIYPLHVVD